ncbi:IS3 family transposase [Megasphaera paucivorans]|uniref:HTH-like domain-containing protein n=1 Tax=Megasphaera paucivorans TaxID=349095 RepID=A0A1H0C4V0_9FIRM|nr:IS3 family transposase [Megasphaera paucivorans]SDN52883.1 HTH-like domain-containing protein [Megasphaera paucivorans]
MFTYEKRIQALQAYEKTKSIKKTIRILGYPCIKQDPGVALIPLSNREKVVIIDALRSKYSLPFLLKSLDMANSSYYYQKHSMQREDKYKSVRKLTKKYFVEYKKRYGYRRIYGLLKRDGIILSEKVIHQLMKQEKLQVMMTKKKSYSSYQGENYSSRC